MEVFFLIPLVYLAVITPAWLVGRPLDELLLIYMNQAKTYKNLTRNAPKLYQWIPQTYYDIFILSVSFGPCCWFAVWPSWR